MLFKGFKKKTKSERQKVTLGGRASNGPSIITADVVIEGSLISGGELQIDGTVNGDVRALAAVVDARGIIHGEVSAEDIVVRGRVIGPIRGIRVSMQAGSHIEGDVISESISIENGSHIDGKIRHSEDPLNEPPSYETAQPAQAAVTYDQASADAQSFGVYDEDGFRPVTSSRKPGTLPE